MAYQKSDIKLEGSVGDLSFYRQGEAYLVRTKGGVDSKRFATDPKLERSRENTAEFGRASAIAKQIRQSLREALPLFHEGTMQTRLNARMLQILKNDGINGRGERRLIPENLPLLIGFSFNRASAWKDVYYARFDPSFDATAGKLRVVFQEHWAPSVLQLPKEASGVRFTVAAVSVDAENETCSGAYEHSPVLPALGRIPHQVFELDIETADLPVVLLTGLTFFKEKGGYQIPIDEPQCNALDVVNVFGATG
ncbi:hypothetical protein [Parapedobacter sp. DT-150]|uniref:hypothetical protein n=1 Tax=Parapedobacter sp. DT-150 TaxID=3396162 RepID=UPI003F1B956D